MSSPIQFGIRINVDGSKESAERVEQVRASTADLGKTAEATGQQIATANQHAISSTAQLSSSQAKATEELRNTESQIKNVGASTVQLATANQNAAGSTVQLAIAQAKATEGLRNTESQIKNVGVSAAQMSAALRGLPAQITDIVTGLASGQAPMTVLIQQGGQLKDMFGGIGPAVKAIGGYILNLIGPFTIAAAAAAALTFAYASGSKEAQEYNRAIIMTGNAAGVTSGQLSNMARSISKTIGTQGEAAAALAQMVGSGRVASESLQRFTTVAIQMERAVGQSVADTVKDLAELGKSPVEASEKLNEKYRYLTATVYEQIKALQDQGKAEEAAAVAQKAYADAFDQRSKQLISNLGYVERAWNGLKDAAKKGWDAILNIGRPDSAKDLANGLSDKLAAAEQKLKQMENLGGAGRDAAARQAKVVEGLRQEHEAARENYSLQQKMAAAEAESARQQEARIAWIKDGDKHLSRQKQMELEIVKVREKGAAAGIDQAEIEKRIGQIREKYQEKTSSAGNADLANLRARIASEQQYVDQLKVHGVAVDKLNDGEKLSLQYQEQLKGKLDAKTRAHVQALLVQAQALAAVQKEREALELAGKASLEAAEAHTKYIESLQKGLDKIKADVEAQREHNERLGLGKEAIAALDAAKLESQAATLEGMAIKQLDRDLDETQYELYMQQAKALRELADLKRSGAVQEVALEEARKAEEAWKKTADTIEQSLTDAIMRGFEGGKSIAENFRDTLVNMFKTMVLRPVIQAMVQPFVSPLASMLGGFAGASGASGGMGAMGAGSNGLGIMNAFNGIWQNGGIAGTFGRGIEQFGGWMGNGTIQNFGLGMQGYSSLSSYGTQGLGVGQMAGQFMNGMGGFMAGRSIGQAISNGYAVSGSGNGLVNAGAAIGAIWGPIGSAIGGAIGGAVNRAFGRKLKDTGIEGSISGSDFTGNSFKFYKGGWFRSDKTERSALDEQTSGVFSDAVATMHDSFVNLGKTIGTSSTILDDFSHSFKLSLNGLSDEAAQKEIQRALSGTSDAMASAFVDKFRTSVMRQVERTEYLSTRSGNDDDTQMLIPYTVKETVSVTQAALSTQLDPYIADMLRIFDAQKASLAGVRDAEGELAAFTQSLFALGDSFVENKGYVNRFFEAIDFDKLEAAAKRGETVMDTFGRLSSIFDTTNAVAQALGQDMRTAFGAVGLASTEARQRLITLTGGLESLAQGAAFFAQNFLTEEERMQPLIQSVTAQMAELGHASVTTKEEFASLVKGIDLASESGATLYAKLMAISPQFLDVANYLAASKAQASQASEAALEALQEQRRQAVEDARTVLTEAYQREAEVRQSMITQFQDLAKSMRSFRDSLAIGNLSPLSPVQKYLEARARFDRTYSLAKAGDPTAMGDLQGVAEQFLQASQAINASSEAYVKDYESVRSALDVAATAADTQVEIARSELAAIDRAVSGIVEVNKSVISVREAVDKYFAAGGTRSGVANASAAGTVTRNSGIPDNASGNAYLQEISDYGTKYGNDAYYLMAGINDYSAKVENAEQLAKRTNQTLDQVIGASGKTLDYWANVQALYDAGQHPTASSDIAMTISAENKAAVEDLYGSLLGRQSDASGLAYWSAKLETGTATLDQVKQQILNSAEYISAHGSHADGLDFVPFNGYRAILHEREAVLTASEADEWRAGKNGKEVAAALDRQSAAIQQQADAIDRLAESIEAGQVQSQDELRTMLQHMTVVVSRKAVPA